MPCLLCKKLLTVGSFVPSLQGYVCDTCFVGMRNSKCPDNGAAAKAIETELLTKKGSTRTMNASSESNNKNQISTNPKDAFGRMKPPLHLIPPAASIVESLAMQNGADKYGPYNWRGKTVAATVYIAACMRHLAAWMDGEENALDSNAHHLGHARASLGIIIDAQVQGTLVDDRPIAGKAGQLLEQLTRKSPMLGSEPREMTDQFYAAAKELKDEHENIPTQYIPKTKRAYIAGPMRGLPQFNFPAFDKARDLAKLKGIDPISPADIDRSHNIHENTDPNATNTPEMARAFVERDVDALLSLRAENGDMLALLPDWQKSTGAVAEFFVARWLGLRIVDALTFEAFYNPRAELGVADYSHPIIQAVLTTLLNRKKG